MARATLNGTVIAEADNTVVVEGNHYFPPSSVRWDHFAETNLTTGCPWKGTANYYDITVGDSVQSNAAWTYHHPKDAAVQITDHVAFYPVVTVEP